MLKQDRSQPQNAPEPQETKLTPCERQPADRLNNELRTLQMLMEAEYGGLFATHVDAAEKILAWESRWRTILDGKTPRRIRQAIDLCFKHHRVPFTTAHFEEMYRTCTKAPEEPKKLTGPVSVKDRSTGMTALQTIRKGLAKGGRRRTVRNIDAGIWTDEDEKRFTESSKKISCKY